MTAERQAELEQKLQAGMIEDEELVELLTQAYGHDQAHAEAAAKPKGRFVDDEGRACYV